jgi:extracellular elastinolytic metalloproteinase
MVRRSILAAAVCALLAPASALAVGDVHEHASSSGGNFDSRSATVAPTPEQRATVAELGASASWNRFGTPASLRADDGWLAEGLGDDAVAAARAFVAANAALFRLSSQSAGSLELVNDVVLPGTDAHAVLFRQRFGDLAAVQDGLLAVGVSEGRVAYASSSIAGDAPAPAAPTLSAVEAWLAAATHGGLDVSIVGVANVRTEDGWTVFDVAGFAQPQRARAGALPIPAEGVRAVFEANVVESGHAPLAYSAYVDGRSGDVLVRHTRVEYVAEPTVEAFSGSYTPTSCGEYHDFSVGSGVRSIDVVVDAPLNDIIVELYYGADRIATSDIPLGPNPEAIHYEPPVVAEGMYRVRVCPFDEAQLPPTTYTGTFTATPASSAPVAYPPKWSMFVANPALDYGSTDTRVLGCWEAAVNGEPIPGCDLELKNLAARAPWDYDPRANAPSFTTKGNAALSGEAWLSPLTPAEQYRPVAADRDYTFPWQNTWKTSSCSPTALTPGGNDIDAAVTNLFAMHNRMHDWSYFLGFTETTYNLQDSNYGNGTPGPFPGREADPEIGNAQAGALDGGAPSYLGRDNANQVTLQDGIPGITNMYLWQPIAAAFYAPCVDGDYDMSVIGHEYTHAISNRMVAGPDAGLVADQSRAMGESWSDLSAVEYLNEHGYVPTGGENPFAVGPYVTGNHQTGIRNHAMNDSPLNYSNVGYDLACNQDLVTSECTGETQVHADGEIWSATNFSLREALVAKHGAGDAATQLRCAGGELPADQCPGNRRWAQIMFDAFLLMQSDVSMLDARDAYLAADQLRFGGANATELWRVFASRGMGAGASTTGGDDVDPVPAFDSPREQNGTLSFRLVDEAGEPVAGSVYVGRYEARVTPIADTVAGTELGDSATFVPGEYELVAQADGHGLTRLTATSVAGRTTTITVTMPTNWASSTQGATATGDGVNLASLIDDTEETSWSALGRQPSVAGTQVTVALGGGAHVVDRVNVSALLRHRNPDITADPGSQNRFSALRAFELWTSTDGTSFTKIFTSPADAFPGGIPRPLAPNLIFRTFDVPDTTATHVRLVVVSNQCTGGGAYAGEQDADPANTTDCAAGSAQDENVRAAELQVFSSASSAAEQAPNLEVTATSSTRVSAREYRLEATVANTGDAAAGASETRFVADGSSELCVVATAALEPGASATLTCSWDTRRVSKGAHDVTVTADAAGAVDESDETDNTGTVRVDVR